MRVRILLACLLFALPALAQEPEVRPYNRTEAPGEPPPVPGVEGDVQRVAPEVQDRGPIHEAFAQPGNGGVGQPGPVVTKKPPAPVPETPPDQKPQGDDVAWIPGYWAWDADRSDFLWVSGFWRAIPGGRRWVPGYWAQTDDGWRWVSGFWASTGQNQVPYLEAPPDSLDRGPSQPSPDDESFYVPGIWLFRNSRWAWRPGYWSVARPGYVYSPSRYCWTPGGYIYSPGFWDLPLASRGVLFAPVYFPQQSYLAPGFAFQPSYAVNPAAALASLWIGPGGGNYAFGNYYAPRYGRAGYRSWLAYGPAYRDPLYSYYRYANRTNPGWRAGLVSAYQGGVRGTALPPRAVVPLASYRNPAVRLAALPPAQLRQQVAVANKYARMRDARVAHEARYAAPAARAGYSARTPSAYGGASPAPIRSGSSPGNRSAPAYHSAPALRGAPSSPGPRSGMAPATQPAPHYTPSGVSSTPQSHPNMRNSSPALQTAPHSTAVPRYTAPPAARPAQHYSPPAVHVAPHYSASPVHRAAPPVHHAAPAHHAPAHGGHRH